MSLAEDRDRLRADPARRGFEFSSAWRARVDAWLVEQFASATAVVGPQPGDVALAAVGGYGRGDLAPASDLDLLLLYRGKTVPAELAERLWYPIWDAGLKLGHAVRTVDDALGWPPTTSTPRPRSCPCAIWPERAT